MDPTPAIKEVVDGRNALIEASGPPAELFGFDTEFDTIAAFLLVMRGKPDQGRMRRAHKHFLAMVEANKNFWSRVEVETDNDREWIPNANQTSAFGVNVSSEMALRWQDVLTDVDDILQGRKLVPFWRVDNPRDATTGYGLNFKKIFMDPPDMDIVLLIHGGSLAPYIERGELANMQAWGEFQRLTGRQTGMFALWFN